MKKEFMLLFAAMLVLSLSPASALTVAANVVGISYVHDQAVDTAPALNALEFVAIDSAISRDTYTVESSAWVGTTDSYFVESIVITQATQKAGEFMCPTSTFAQLSQGAAERQEVTTLRVQMRQNADGYELMVPVAQRA